MGELDVKKQGTLGVKNLLGNTHPAVIAVWAALISVGNMLPSLPMIGTGGTFSVSAAFAPLAGVLFGPIGGAICAAIGGFIGQIIAPHIAWLGMGTFLVGTINAFTAGLISRGKWIPGVGIIAVGTVLWFTTEIGRQAPIFPTVFYSLGVIMAVLGGIFGARWLLKSNIILKGVGIWLASFAGFVAAASIANFLGIIIIQIPAEVWKFLAWVAPWERTIFALGAAVIGVPLLIALPKIGIFVGPDVEEEDDDEDDE
ncbi:MAG: ECF transporter S component [Bacillota bacterium]